MHINTNILFYHKYCNTPPPLPPPVKSFCLSRTMRALRCLRNRLYRTDVSSIVLGASAWRARLGFLPTPLSSVALGVTVCCCALSAQIRLGEKRPCNKTACFSEEVSDSLRMRVGQCVNTDSCFSAERGDAGVCWRLTKLSCRGLTDGGGATYDDSEIAGTTCLRKLTDKNGGEVCRSGMSLVWLLLGSNTC